VPDKVHVLVTSGYPADTHFYQSLKGVAVPGDPIVKDGGVVVHCTPAYHGILEVVNDNLPKDKLKRMGFDSADSIEDALNMARHWHTVADVAILPAGAETMTRIGAS
jgi:hypothetical protein